MAMVRICDKCRKSEIPAKSPIFICGVTFEKVQPLKKKVLNVNVDLCDSCLSNLLSAFGRFKNQWLTGKVETGEPKGEVTPNASEEIEPQQETNPAGVF